MEYFPRLCKMSAWLELVELQFQTPSRATDVLLISSGRQRDGFIRLKAIRIAKCWLLAKSATEEASL